jgi:3-dehydroquinate dehydratase-2|tara:strand:+ start:3232 stop:3669 length:438 start_codon:yes stop_codon:yes gene_type:complete
MKKIAIINGPNLDRLGEREPTIYGDQTLADLEALLNKEAEALGISLQFHQSNHEGVIIDTINNTLTDGSVHGIILNPGALTHTSLALKDSIAGANLPTVEVHISNIYKREAIRQHSISAPVCLGVISGLGFEGYRAALRYLSSIL